MTRKILLIAALAMIFCLSACSNGNDPEKSGITVEFSATQRSGDAPLTVQFSDLSDGEGISAWAWDFGDGGSSSTQNPSHTFTTDGSYHVTLTVTGTAGTETLTRSDYIVIGGGGETTDEFCFMPSTITVVPGETVNFNIQNGISPYQFGYINSTDIQSYSDVAQIQAQFDASGGSGFYVVGINDNCTDKLAAMDSTGEICYLTIIISVSGDPNPDPNPDPEPGPTANADEVEVFDIVNDERQSVGRSALQWCDGLYQCAKAHSNDMCDRGFFSHVNPEGEGPSDRARTGHAGSYTFPSIVPNPYLWGIGENIAWGYRTAEEVMIGWMNSPGHRANILNPDYTHIGVGQCDGCKTHWTQTFGTR